RGCLRRGLRRACRLGRSLVGGGGEIGRSRQHLIGNASELRERRFDLGREKRYLVRHLLLTPGARFRVAAYGAIELFIGAHSALEHSNGARQRADLVAVVAVWYCD